MPDFEIENVPSKNFADFVGWGFQFLLLAVGTWGVTELSSMSKSVQELNVKMAVVVERDATRSEQVRGLEGRVKALEDKKAGT